ncbi:hemolysin family protein [Saccharothrix violaceirubra]|uniref:CBS domain containing-hemolysin-like protein n=1 Tax=Saccharothrix violaceirubra TaxID=413306 RepID=A0A7W7WUF9_9PSEU|nr:hemolysin family protein [Saccharothrix violaceirubra]MBB4964265.1 CBS domain containing-hemolysin-like protein [Saccharothrix violaceirubra]
MLILSGLLAILALTAATGYFVAQEFAYMAVDRGRLHHLAENGDKAAARAYRVTQRLSFMLSGAQFGITVTALLVGYVAEPLLGTGLADLLGLPPAVAVPLSMAVALVVATVVQMVLGELFPKNLAIAEPEALAKALAPSTVVYLRIAGPVIRLFDAAANRLLRAVGIEPVEELPQGATPEDLKRIIGDAGAEGHLDPELSRLLDRGLGFRELVAEQAMTPRVSVRVVRAEEPVSRVVDLLDTGYSRFPVIGDGTDDLRGIVGLAEVLTVPPRERTTTPVGAVAVPALVVPATLALPGVLERLRSERRQTACVVDEFGGFAGVVTLEDLAEELVGEIHDEDDVVAESIEEIVDGVWRVPGRMRLDEIADATGVELPLHDAYDTVSGLLLHRLGRVAEPDDRVEVDGVSLRVAEVTRNVPGVVVLEVAR